MAEFSFTIGSGPSEAVAEGVTGTLSQQAQANLIPDFQCDANMLKLVASYVKSLETVEAAVETICDLLSISDYRGRALDDLGALVGQPRNGFKDSDYQQTIAVRIVANAAQSDADTLIYLVKQSLGFTGNVSFRNSYPAGFILEIPDLIASDANVEGAAEFLRETKAGGVLGVFTYHFFTPFQYDNPVGAGYNDGSYAIGVNV